MKVIVRITMSLAVKRVRNAESKKKYTKSLLPEFLEALTMRNERYSKKPVESNETQMYTRDMMRMRMEYGFTSAPPMIPPVMVSIPIEKVTNRMITPTMGARP